IVVCTTEFARAEFRRIGAPNVELVPLGVDLDLFSPRRRDGRLRADFTQKNRMRFNYQNFNGRIGDSDIHGSLSYTTGKPRPKLSGDMESKQL
ncbi:AsmA family protein, partial [Mycobacterium tuberculosis]|nr:AsmA family protein [Mycobacterium tuberculosis]